jgi:hypothetical protein
MAVVVGLGMGVVGVGPAAAQPGSTVLSDSVKFSATYSFSNKGVSAFFMSTSCALLSDGEAKQLPCRMSGVWHQTTTGLGGSAKLVSPDGTTTWTYSILTHSNNNYRNATMKGTGLEADAPEGGKPSPAYKATMTGTWTAIGGPLGGVLSGNVAVFESSTSP